MAIARRASESVQGPAGAVPADGDWSRDYPCLWEYLTLSQFEDGKPRKTASLLVVFESGRARLWLHDRAENLSAWVSGGSVVEALISLDSGLRAGSLEWRRDAGRK